MEGGVGPGDGHDSQSPHCSEEGFSSEGNDMGLPGAFVNNLDYGNVSQF